MILPLSPYDLYRLIQKCNHLRLDWFDKVLRQVLQLHPKQILPVYEGIWILSPSAKIVSFSGLFLKLEISNSAPILPVGFNILKLT